MIIIPWWVLAGAMVAAGSLGAAIVGMIYEGHARDFTDAGYNAGWDDCAASVAGQMAAEPATFWPRGWAAPGRHARPGPAQPARSRLDDYPPADIVEWIHAERARITHKLAGIAWGGQPYPEAGGRDA